MVCRLHVMSRHHVTCRSACCQGVSDAGLRLENLRLTAEVSAAKEEAFSTSDASSRAAEGLCSVADTARPDQSRA